MVEIELADPPDADRIVDLWIQLAEGQRVYDSHILGGPNRTRIRESILRHVSGNRLLVARREDILGFVMFALEQGSFEQDVVRGTIENLYVEPDSRNEGIGSALLSRAESCLDDRGAVAVSLNVMAENAAARRFYRRHGYGIHRVEFEKDID